MHTYLFIILNFNTLLTLNVKINLHLLFNLVCSRHDLNYTPLKKLNYIFIMLGFMLALYRNIIVLLTKFSSGNKMYYFSYFQSLCYIKHYYIRNVIILLLFFLTETKLNLKKLINFANTRAIFFVLL